MKTIKSKEFKPNKAWDALDIANISGTSVRLHWTDQAYKWHINDGEEVFAVLDGQVNMLYRKQGEEHSSLLLTGHPNSSSLIYLDVTPKNQRLCVKSLNF